MQQYVDIYSLSRHSACFGCQRINVYILSHCVGPLLTLNRDARNHVFKKKGINRLIIVKP